MSSKNLFWIIPFLFSIIFILLGFVISVYEEVFILNINGRLFLVTPPNFLTFYNTRFGPLSSIFLSNFIFDGWSNFQALMIYVAVFVATNLFAGSRMRRAWFMVIGSVLSGILSMAIIRSILPSYMYSYGQSAVIAGFAGITMFFAIQEGLTKKGLRQTLVESKSKLDLFLKIELYFISLALGIGALSGFFLESRMTVIIHTMALVLGVTLAGIFTLITVPSNKKTAYLIPEKETT